MAAGEAKEHEKQALKALTPSWMSLKFQPDIMVASMEYSQAATKYRAAGLLADSVRTHVKSAELKEKQHDQFGAGRAYEQAASICDGKPEAGDPLAYWEPAIRCYRLSGKGELAAKLILKVAGLREKQGDFSKAKQAYDDAVEVFEQDEKDYQLGDVYKQYIGFLVRSEMFAEALVAMDGHIKVLTQQGHHSFAHKEILAKCVLALWMGDNVSADNALNNSSDAVKDWFMSNEANAGFELVAAFQAYDAEKAEQVLKDQIFTFLQVEVARLARKLRVPTVSAAPLAAPAPLLASPTEPARSQPSAGYSAATAPVASQDGLAEASAAEPSAEAPAPAPAPAPTPEAPVQNLGELLM